MKVCPSCGALNNADNKTCSTCSASLDNTQSQDLPSGEQTSGGYTPRAGPLVGPDLENGPVTQVGQPLGGRQNQLPQGNYIPPTPYGPSTYPRRGEYRKPEPVKTSNSGTMVSLIVLLILLIGGGLAYWRFYAVPQGPKKAVRAFIEAAAAGDNTAVKASLCRSSAALLELSERYSGSGNPITGLGHGQQFKEGQDYSLDLKKVEGSRAQVNVVPTSAAISSGTVPSSLPKDGMPVIVVKENGKWKVDLMQTAFSIQGGTSAPSSGG